MFTLQNVGTGQMLSRTYSGGNVDTSIPGWSYRGVQTSRGTLDGGARELHVPGVQLLFETYRNVLTNFFGVAAPDSIGVLVPLRSQGAAMFNGREVAQGGACIWNTNLEFNSVAPPADIFCVIVDRSLLVEYLGETELFDVEPALLRANIVCGASAAAVAVAGRLRELVSAAFEQRWDPMTRSSQDRIRRAVLETLSPFLVESLAPNRNLENHRRHCRIVRRARELALARPGESLQVLELCRELGVSRRTVQESFRVVLGISPLAYLRALRLNGARRSLYSGQTVQEVAEHWGFWHWSRFSRDYRELFGELPSQTLRRTSRAPSVSLST